MVYLRDEIAKQARQGSVAAIIQLLNENLASWGVRTRAVRDNGVLQLLCEAETAEELDRSTLVPQIKEILETISPKNIRRVKINSRIVREQQSLWLEEISRDPQTHLLWFEEITLARKNPFQYLGSDDRERKEKAIKQSLAKPSSSPFVRDRRQWQRGMIGGVLLTVVLLLMGWGAYKILVAKQIEPLQAIKPKTSVQLTGNQQNGNLSNNLTNQSTPDRTDDPFAVAVRIAEQASLAGKTANTRTQWLEIANRWQQASDLMAQVSEQDSRYKTAQNRKTLYRKNSESALRQLEKRR